MATLQQMLDDIKITLPYSTATFTDAVVIRWMNELQDEVWRYMATTEAYEFITTTNPLYSLSSDMVPDMIKKVLVSNSTTIDGTESYGEYKYRGMDDELDTNAWYDALGQLGIYPTPDKAGYNVKVFYEPKPLPLSTNTLTKIPSLNSEYHDLYKIRVKKIIARSGHAPDVELSNNYAADENDFMGKIRMNYLKRKSKLREHTYDYRESFFEG